MVITVKVLSLIGWYREALLAVAPIAKRAGIPWKGNVYDPWENIESTLFESFVNSSLYNADPDAFRPLPTIGGSRDDYSGFSLLSDQSLAQAGKLFTLYNLQSISGPFDNAEFIEISENLTTTQETVFIPVDRCEWVLHARIGGTLEAVTEFSYKE